VVASAGIFAATYLVPVFLGRVRGFSSFDIGTTVFVTGFGMMVSAPLTMRLLRHFDPRVVMALGLVVFAVSLWMFSGIGPEWGFDELFWPHVLRGVAGMLCVVPAANLALGELAGEELRQASGLFNVMRNLGGALGIAMVNTWLQHDTRLHVARLGEALGAQGARAGELMAGLAQQMPGLSGDFSHALALAQGLFAQQVQRHALALAFGDSFRVMAWLLLATLVLVPMCRPGSDPSQQHPVEA
jgi:DHA2 family multidrug resistance protein